jgi:hypothetical protein
VLAIRSHLVRSLGVGAPIRDKGLAQLRNSVKLKPAWETSLGEIAPNGQEFDKRCNHRLIPHRHDLRRIYKMAASGEIPLSSWFRGEIDPNSVPKWNGDRLIKNSAASITLSRSL